MRLSRSVRSSRSIAHNKTSVADEGAMGTGSGVVYVTTPIPSSYFGMALLGPIETDISGSGNPVVWPIWSPTVWRAIDNYGPPDSYADGISIWAAVETANGVYNWNLFDPVWAKLIEEGVTDVIMSLQAIPQWAEVGNAYSFSATVTAGTPAVVTAAGQTYANGLQVFFTGGSLPTGVSAGTNYYVINNAAGSFNLSLTSGGTAINTTGSNGSSTVTAANTPPSNQSYLSAWVTAYLTRATLKGLPIKFIEGLNEPDNYVGFYVGSVAELVTMQQTIYNAAKAYDPTIQVISPPVSRIDATYQKTYITNMLAAGMGSYFDIFGFHGYEESSVSTYAADLDSLKVTLATYNQQGKPIWNTEFSSLTGVAATNETYLSYETLIGWSKGVSRNVYYAYDSTDNLWSQPNTLNVAGIAYQQLVNWMTGAVMTPLVNYSGVVYTCGFTRSGGYQALAVWTSDGSTPSYTVPPWATQYRDLTGAITTGLGATVTIGANPILFENKNPYSYYAQAANFAGASYVINNSVTATDTPYLSVSFWIRWDGIYPTGNFNTGKVTLFVSDQDNNYCPILQWANGVPQWNLVWNGYSSSRGTPTWNMHKWNHFLVSIDSSTATNSCAIYLNDQLVSWSTGATNSTASTIPLNGKPFCVGGDDDGRYAFGAIADFWVSNQNLLSGGAIPTATRRQFINVNGKPVYLGSTGQIPTGTSPLIFLTGGASGFSTNLGTGGSVSVTGSALTSVVSSPTDY